FIDEMAAACVAADLIVTRSGASTTAELAVLHKPSILIPYPHATDNHQEHNARAFVDAGAAMIVADSELGPEILLERIRTLLADPRALQLQADAAGTLAKPAAADTIASDIMTLVYES